MVHYQWSYQVGDLNHWTMLPTCNYKTCISWGQGSLVSLKVNGGMGLRRLYSNPLVLYSIVNAIYRM